MSTPSCGFGPLLTTLGQYLDSRWAWAKSKLLVSVRGLSLELTALHYIIPFILGGLGRHVCNLVWLIIRLLFLS